MAADFVRKTSVPLLTFQPEVVSTAFRDVASSAVKRRTKSVSETWKPVEDSSSPTSPDETRHSWWQNFSTLMARGRFRRYSSSLTQPNEALHTDLQWFGSPLATASSSDNGHEVLFTSLCYNETGELLAAGDKSGNVIVLESDSINPSSSSTISEWRCTQLDYKVYHTYRSHSGDFDFQKAVNVEAAIVKIRWLKRSSPVHQLLTSNERSVKLWRLGEKTRKLSSTSFSDINHNNCVVTSPEFKLPVVDPIDPPTVSASLRREFRDGHEYAIKSVSINSDQETFLSADDLRINVWNMDVSNEAYNIVDLKPPEATELTELPEVITSAEFHPEECNVFVYTTNTGDVRLCDMRQRALCDRNACKLFQSPNVVEHPGSTSISDVKFSRTNGSRYLLTRDYMALKVWDTRCDGQEPCEVYQVQPYLAGRLAVLHDSSYLQDRFECDWGYNDRVLSSGSYHDIMHVFDRDLKTDLNLRLSSVLDGPSFSGRQTMSQIKSCQVVPSATFRRKKEDVSVLKLNYSHKMKHIAWHPDGSKMAAVSCNRIYGLLVKEGYS